MSVDRMNLIPRCWGERGNSAIDALESKRQAILTRLSECQKERDARQSQMDSYLCEIKELDEALVALGHLRKP